MLKLAGGKGVGKSNVKQVLSINRLLKELQSPIVLIDLDPGIVVRIRNFPVKLIW